MSQSLIGSEPCGLRGRGAGVVLGIGALALALAACSSDSAGVAANGSGNAGSGTGGSSASTGGSGAGANGGSQTTGGAAGTGTAGTGTGGTGVGSGVVCDLSGCSEGGGGTAGAGTGGTGTAGKAGGSTAGQGGQSGTEIPEGTPGTVGNKCKNGTCDAGLICGTSQYCQPATSSLGSKIKQAVPPPDSTNVPPGSPIVLFMDGLAPGVSFKIEQYATSGKKDVTSQVTVLPPLTTPKGADIYVLAPKQEFLLGSSVVVTLSGTATGTLAFNIAFKSPAAADGALGFEGAVDPIPTSSPPVFKPPPGWAGFGDVGVVSGKITAGSAGAGGATGATLFPSEGKLWAGISTGNALWGAAVGETSSMLESGPITTPGSTVTFDYDFHSAEIPQYCSGNYDDTFLAIVAGPAGTVAKLVSSVNTVCAQLGVQGSSTTAPPETVTGTGADSVGNYGSGKQTFSIAADVGTPRVVAFVVTDVADTAVTSLVAIDNVQVK